MSNASSAALVDIAIHADHAVVSVPGQTAKSIDLIDLKAMMNEVIRQQGEAASGGGSLPSRPIILPEGCIAFEQSGTSRFVRMYVPGQIQAVTYSGRGTVPKGMKIPFPNFIIDIPMKLQDKSWRVETSSVRYRATDLSRAQVAGLTNLRFDNQHIWEPPLPNFFGSGRACFGSASPVSGFQDNLSGLWWYYSFLYSAAFNEDLSPHSITSRWWDKIAPNGSNYGAGILKFLNGKEQFPYYILSGSTHPAPKE